MSPESASVGADDYKLENENNWDVKLEKSLNSWFD